MYKSTSSNTINALGPFLNRPLNLCRFCLQSKPIEYLSVQQDINQWVQRMDKEGIYKNPTVNLGGVIICKA